MKNFILALVIVLFCAAPAMARGQHGGNHGHNGHYNHGHYNHGHYRPYAPVYPWWYWLPAYNPYYGNPYYPRVNPYYPPNPYQNNWNTDGNGYGG